MSTLFFFTTRQTLTLVVTREFWASDIAKMRKNVGGVYCYLDRAGMVLKTEIGILIDVYEYLDIPA